MGRRRLGRDVLSQFGILLMSTTKTELKKLKSRKAAQRKSKEEKERLYQNKQWYSIRSLLGNTWAHWFVLIGARERGKSYSVQDYCLNQYFRKNVPFYWMRLNEAATKNMLMNNGAKMFEPLLVRKYHLENIRCKGDSVFLPDGRLLCRVYGLSTAYNNKGSALFDKNTFKGANIIVDEFQLEKGQKRTFDIVYNLKMQIENICRSEYKGVRTFFIGNNTEECSDILSLFNFIPLEWGIYKLKKKNCIIDYIPNTEAYEQRRKTALANELDNGTGNFTNKIQRDLSLIYKGRLDRPQYIIKFSKSPEDWFTVWTGNVVCEYNKEQKPVKAMKRYLDENFTSEIQGAIIEMNDARAFKFRSLIVQQRFYYELQLIKKT